jgi:hypothetical protein
MDAKTETEIERATAGSAVVLVGGEVRHVGRPPSDTFRDLNRRRAASGLPPVAPASSLVLAREAQALAAARLRAWRRDHALTAVPTGHTGPRWRVR